jgi:alcohol dehydrogenase YqhD (iron-dependent ADH family)
VLSFLYDTAHGATLSIIYPAWMKVLKDRAGDRIQKLGQDLWGLSTADETIEALESFFSNLGSPLKCQEAGINPSNKGEILALMNKQNAGGMHLGLSDEERAQLVEYIF